MAKLKPFKAIRPTRDKIHLVATRPVYTYRKSILKAKLEENPYTFIRIINPEYNEIVKTKANSKERFLNVKSKFEEFCKAGILVQDSEEKIYLYRQTKDGHHFTGIIAGASVEEYKNDSIKKHEATLTSREAMFTEYLDLVGFNAEPVLLSYPHNAKLEKVYETIMTERAEYEFSTTDLVKHELWILNQKNQDQVLALFSEIDTIYIADGHHRSASSSRLADTYNKKGIKTHNHDYFLAYFIDENSLKILEFNRLVKSLKNIDLKHFLAELGKSFDIEKLSKAEKPKKEHQITMNLKNEWYLLTCKANIINNNHAVSCLDPEILTQYILTPLLGIEDLKTDKNIEFVSGNLGLEAISEAIECGKADLGFVLFPLTMKQVIRVADNQLTMPPKSTWVEPKLRSGLTIYNIKE
ncbi:MAG: DUF1015 domain-containing protein [Bacteroidota bacterium]